MNPETIRNGPESTVAIKTFKCRRFVEFSRLPHQTPHVLEQWPGALGGKSVVLRERGSVGLEGRC